MSRISDVSSRLGEYMLLGWVLTDEGCEVCSIPMLRSPAGQSPERHFCAQCQATPDAPTPSGAGKGVADRVLQTSSNSSPPVSRELQSSSTTSSPPVSRVSTPPTEVSSTLSSPTFAPPPDPHETMRRRAQSDMASAEIGARMLKGWAMLGEECPSDSCHGIPLVRPPKPGGGKDPRKECVVCGKTYVFEKDARGLDQLVLLGPAMPPAAVPSLGDSASRPQAAPAPASNFAAPMAATRNVINHEPMAPFEIQHTSPQTSIPSNIAVLADSISSLERSLRVLASQLTSLSSVVPVDHEKIGHIAVSIERVTNALRAVKHLHYQEISAHAQ